MKCGGPSVQDGQLPMHFHVSTVTWQVLSISMVWVSLLDLHCGLTALNWLKLVCINIADAANPSVIVITSRYRDTPKRLLMLFLL